MPIAATLTPTQDAAATIRPARGRRLTMVVLGAVVAAVVVGELITGSGWLTTAWAAITTASPTGLMFALAATLASMACFGMSRRAALHAAAVPVPAGQAIGASFAAGAVHTTMPGGTVLAAAYFYRCMRTWGASTSVAAWCLTTTGVIASTTLALFTIAGIAAGGTASSTSTLIEIGAFGAIIAALVIITRSPRLLARPATRLLGWINQVRSKPAETGLKAVLATIDELDKIRPTRRHWLTCASWSMANWILDAICVWSAATAVGVHVSLAALVIAYTAGMVAASVSPLPAGAGAVETAMVIGLTTGGATAATALAAVLTYRMLSIGSTAVVGWALLARRRVHHRGPRCTDRGDLIAAPALFMP